MPSVGGGGHANIGNVTGLAMVSQVCNTRVILMCLCHHITLLAVSAPGRLLHFPVCR